MAIICRDYPDKAGFLILWQGMVECGDNIEPKTYDYDVEFDLENELRPGRFAYLLMRTAGIHNVHNAVYINGKKLGCLQKGIEIQTFFIELDVLRNGKNTFKLTARNASGGIGGNVDDIKVYDPILIYAAK